MFRTIDDFLEIWEYETEATLKVFQELTDESLGQQVTPDGRSLGRLAWHIVQTLPEMAGRTGLDLHGPAENEPIPPRAQDILQEFRKAADSLADAVRNQWTDDDLHVEDDMYGESWPRGKTLVSVVNHQTHHRGQMTVLMRQAGLKVPGVYGPSREEWDQYGMPAQE